MKELKIIVMARKSKRMRLAEYASPCDGKGVMHLKFQS
jgi:hypothetical protein